MLRINNKHGKTEYGDSGSKLGGYRCVATDGSYSRSSLKDYNDFFGCEIIRNASVSLLFYWYVQGDAWYVEGLLNGVVLVE